MLGHHRLSIIDLKGGQQPVVDKSSGFLTPPHQVKPFCDKIEYLFLNPEKRIEMGKAGQEFVKKNFEASQIFERIETYLKPGN